jgi:hypothetical protein
MKHASGLRNELATKKPVETTGFWDEHEVTSVGRSVVFGHFVDYQCGTDAADNQRAGTNTSKQTAASCGTATTDNQATTNGCLCNLVALEQVFNRRLELTASELVVQGQVLVGACSTTVQPSDNDTVALAPDGVMTVAPSNSCTPAFACVITPCPPMLTAPAALDKVPMGCAAKAAVAARASSVVSAAFFMGLS